MTDFGIEFQYLHIFAINIGLASFLNVKCFIELDLDLSL